MHDHVWLKRMFYQKKKTTGMMMDVTQFDDSDIYEIEVRGQEVNDCDVMETPNVRNNKNENDPQTLKMKNLTNPK